LSFGYKQTIDNQIIRIHLVKIFKTFRQLQPCTLHQSTTRSRENPYFWPESAILKVHASSLLFTSTSTKAMLKKFFSTALLLVTLSGFATAQRIAYVDVTAVLEALPEYQKAQEQLDKIATQWRQEIAGEQDKIKGMYSKYQAEQVLLSEEMKKTREEEILTKEKEVREMQRQKFGPEGALFKKREELVKPIQDKVYATITSFAESKGFEFIFDKGSASGMLFADKKYDKTEDIKSLLTK